MIFVLPWGNHNGNEGRCCHSISLCLYLLREDVWKLLRSASEKIFNRELHTSLLLTGWTKEKGITTGKHRSSITVTRPRAHIFLRNFLSINCPLATIAAAIREEFHLIFEAFSFNWYAQDAYGPRSDRRTIGKTFSSPREKVVSLIEFFNNEKMREPTTLLRLIKKSGKLLLSFVDRQRYFSLSFFFFFFFSSETKGRRNVRSERRNSRHYSEKGESRHFFSLGDFLICLSFVRANDYE